MTEPLKDAAQAPGAAPAASEKCMRRLEPEFTQPCPNDAAVGFKVTLRPTVTVQKRYGRTSLLTFIIDLPVCESCFPKANVMEITDPDLRTHLGKEAQRINAGFLVDWGQTILEPLPYDAPAYVALRKQIAKQAANDGGADAV